MWRGDRGYRLLGVLLAALPFAARAQTFTFRDVARTAGLRGVSYFSTPWYSAGVAFVDLDDDGWPDLYFGGVKGTSDQLCMNLRDGNFSCAPLDGVGENASDVLAVAAGDYDGDGDLDLYVMREGSNSLLQNDGHAHFVDVTGATATAGTGQPTATGTFFDYDRDGKLDLYLGHWLASEVTSEAQAQILHQDPDGTFHDATAEARLDNGLRSTLAMIAFDYDDDGWQDLYVSGDFAQALLFHNEGGTFRDVTALQPYEVQNGITEGMGIDTADLDGDGRADLYVTGDKYENGAPNGALGSALLINQGDGTFASRGAAFGVDAGFSWGTGIVDFDHDGWPDIFVATNFADHYTIYRNQGGLSFAESDLPGIESGTNVCVTAAFADYDNDGRVDVVLHRIDGHPPQLLHNETVSDGHWLQVQLRTGRDELGAKVTVTVPGRVQTRELLSQTSKGAQNERRFTFGLGSSRLADVAVRFPDGAMVQVADVEADREVVLDKKGLVTAAKWTPAAASSGCAVARGAPGSRADALWLLALVLALGRGRGITAASGRWACRSRHPR